MRKNASCLCLTVVRVCLQVAAERAEKVFSLTTDSNDELLRLMLDWAFGSFKPSGPDGLRPRSSEDGIQLELKYSTST